MKKTNIRELCLFLAIIILLSPLRVRAYSDGNDDSNLVISSQEGRNVMDVDSDADLQSLGSYEYVPPVTTPNGHPVTVEDRQVDFPQADIDDLNERGDNVSNTDTRLYTATRLFNCHSYAWYSQDVSTNHYWMPDPSPYYLDNSYYEVSTPMVGDIICYFDDNETLMIISDDENLHSGIVVAVSASTTSNGLCGNSDTVTVESKWGLGGLYRHNGYQCPYTDHYLTIDPNAEEDSIAEYVKYYRRTGHTHSFAPNDSGDLLYHERKCDCGMVVHAPHKWVLHWAKGAKYIPEYYCTDCGAFTLHPYQPTI